MTYIPPISHAERMKNEPVAQVASEVVETAPEVVEAVSVVEDAPKKKSGKKKS